RARLDLRQRILEPQPVQLPPGLVPGPRLEEHRATSLGRRALDRRLLDRGEEVARERVHVGVVALALEVHAHLAVAGDTHERHVFAPGDAEEWRGASREPRLAER